jgi:hypothetical protein
MVIPVLFCVLLLNSTNIGQLATHSGQDIKRIAAHSVVLINLKITDYRIVWRRSVAVSASVAGVQNLADHIRLGVRALDFFDSTMSVVPVEKAMRVAVLTSGGDSAGMNAAVRAVVKQAIVR